jgi:hypothetical protein
MGSKNRQQVIRILMVALGLCAGVAILAAQQASAVPDVPATDAQAAPVAVVVAPPEEPVMPPKVVCAGDQITISANNSTLSSVLQELHRCMGTKIDIPDAAGAKRIFDKIGPGKASQVLDVLLSNTGYNYIIGASPADEDKVESIVLLSRTTDSTTPPVVDDSRAGTTNRRAFMQMHQAAIPHPMTDADNAAAAELPSAGAAVPPTTPPADGTTPAPAAADGQPATPAAAQTPADAAPAQPQTPAATQPPASNSYSTKPATTEEQITNMQQMFELRKQMNQPPPATPPQP